MNGWRWNGNGSLYENFLLILNGVSTTLTFIPFKSSFEQQSFNEIGVTKSATHR